MSKSLLTRHFFDSADRFSSKAALKEKVGGRYRAITYQQMKERVEQVAAFWLQAGLQPGERVALLAENRPDWPIFDMGLISAGLVNVPIYPTLSAPQLAYILKDSGASAIVASTPLQLKKVLAIYSDCPALKTVISLDPAPKDLQMNGVRLLDATAAVSEGESALKQLRAELDKRLAQAREDDLVSIVYTSGTTGNPKGVMLTHGNFASNAKAAAATLGFNASQVTLSFLPLSHVLERVVNYVVQYCGATVAYAESIDTIAQNLQEVQPTAFVAVPRVFEKIYNRILQNIENEKPLKRKIFDWALAIGKAAAAYTAEGRPVPSLLAAKLQLADRLVFAKIRARTGGQLEFAVSGGAPLMKELAEFFFAVGIHIYEGYGLTETSPVICLNRPGDVRFGSVGQVLDGVEVRIAEDGEILARGPNIMKGYYNLPDATAEVLRADGWFHTGDIGELDAEGFLRITDRKKEIIVMSNGKNVAPQPVENALKTSPYIEQAVMLGNNQKYMAALIYPNYELLEQTARAQNMAFNNRLDLTQSEQVRQIIQAEIDRLTAAFARFEQIKRFALIEEELTQDNDCLTPTLKFKRRNIHQRYSALIDELFAEPAGRG
ncbi:MAG: long-chain fatty acid--CoA ligase [Candidatus Sericytochromatia bacterium]|nr:long-chain fatty acid--CoA ligase [Candidatus Sericytochromatia bacterium]